jgi:hypothetical protein
LLYHILWLFDKLGSLQGLNLGAMSAPVSERRKALASDDRQFDVCAKIAQRLRGFLRPITPRLICLADEHGDPHVF